MAAKPNTPRLSGGLLEKERLQSNVSCPGLGFQRATGFLKFVSRQVVPLTKHPGDLLCRTWRMEVPPGISEELHHDFLRMFCSAIQGPHFPWAPKSLWTVNAAINMHS